MTAWRAILTDADLERMFAAHPDTLAAVVAWIDEHPNPDDDPIDGEATS